MLTRPCPAARRRLEPRVSSLDGLSLLAQAPKFCRDMLICGGVGLPTPPAGKQRSHVSWNHEFLKFKLSAVLGAKVMSLRDRIGIDVGRRLKLEDAIEWAVEHE